MSSFLEKNVVITGGAGGLGRALLKKVLAGGPNAVFLWDINQYGLTEIEQQYESFEKLYTYKIDLTKPEQIERAVREIRGQGDAIDILFNNAGTVLGKPFNECTPDEIRDLIALNVTSAMHITNALLADMIRKGEGHIVNIASAAALMANPGMSVYAGSKWAISGWSDSLRLEMEKHHPGIHVTTVQPSYIDTELFEGVTPPRFTPILETEDIADQIIKAVEKNKPVLRAPFMVKILPFLKGVLPRRLFEFLSGGFFKVYHSMDTFTGRNQTGSP